MTNSYTSRSRDGSMTIELLAVAALLGVITMTAIPLLSQLGRVRQNAADRECALCELENQVELLRAGEQDLVVSSETQRQLENAQLAVETSKIDDGEQVTISLTWTDPAGQQVRPLSLTYWKFVKEEME